MGNNNTLWFIGIGILIQWGHCGVAREFDRVNDQIENAKSLMEETRSLVDDVKRNCR